MTDAGISMPFFDAYLAVDWSARNERSPERPSKDSVWVAEATRGELLSQYCRTRAEAAELIERRLVDHVAAGRRVFVGFDFPYGYPAGFARAAGFPGTPAWRATWSAITALVRDAPDNRSNRFEAACALNERCGGLAGPFWGHPAGRRHERLAPTSPGFPLDVRGGVRLGRLRLTESRLRGTQEAWKLFGNGSVGSQALLGIPVLHRLRWHPRLAAHSLVWPFETGFAPPASATSEGLVLHAEIWPGVVEGEVAVASSRDGGLRDDVQVRSICRWAARADRSAAFAALLSEPPGLTRSQRESCLSEEGSVLGAR